MFIILTVFLCTSIVYKDLYINKIIIKLFNIVIMFIFKGEWFGRFGNNIISVINAICIAKIKNRKIYFDVEHEHLNMKLLNDILNSGKRRRMYLLTPEYCFNVSWNRDYIQQLQEEIAKKFILPILANSSHNLDANNQDVLLIHMRGGDAFGNSPELNMPDKHYIQPPLQFYCKIIDGSKYRKIIIISEDRKNPCVDILLNKYSNIIFQSESALYDFRTLMNGINIVGSHSIFYYAAVLLSNNVQKLYNTHHNVTPIIKSKQVDNIIYNITNYIEPYTWTHSPEQRQLMINLAPENVDIDYDKSNFIENFGNKMYKNNENKFLVPIIILLLIIFARHYFK